MTNTQIPNGFTIYIDDVASPIANGRSSLSLSSDIFVIPQMFSSGEKTTIADLINLVGPDKINIKYYVTPLGEASSHACWTTWELQAACIYGPSKDSVLQNPKYITIATTTIDPKTITKFTGNEWILLDTTNKQIRSITTVGIESKQIGCSFYDRGGWSNVKVNMRIDVTLDLVGFCQSPAGLNLDICTRRVDTSSNISTMIANKPNKIPRPDINSIQHYTPMSYSNNDWILKYWWIILLIILLLIGGGFYYSKNKKSI